MDGEEGSPEARRQGEGAQKRELESESGGLC